MGISIERNNQIGFVEVARNLMADLIANGFTEVGGETDFSNTSLATFDPSTQVDSLVASQPWRLRIVVTAGTAGNIQFNVGTPVQLPDDRSVSFTSTGIESGRLFTNSHLVNGSNYFPLGGSEEEAQPLSSILNVSDHGLSWCVWAEGATAFSWFVIQRPVDNVSGTPLVTGKSPIFCIYSSDGGDGDATTTASQNIKRLTVRESDIHKPSLPVDACRHSQDHNAIFNPIQQISISEGNNYVLTFPNGLNTARFVYKEELDMIAYTSADVLGESAVVNLTVYGEGSPRTYRAMNANSPYSIGSRILFLTGGGGI